MRRSVRLFLRGACIAALLLLHKLILHATCGKEKLGINIFSEDSNVHITNSTTWHLVSPSRKRCFCVSCAWKNDQHKYLMHLRCVKSRWKALSKEERQRRSGCVSRHALVHPVISAFSAMFRVNDDSALIQITDFDYMTFKHSLEKFTFRQVIYCLGSRWERMRLNIYTTPGHTHHHDHHQVLTLLLNS